MGSRKELVILSKPHNEVNLVGGPLRGAKLMRVESLGGTMEICSKGIW